MVNRMGNFLSLTNRDGLLFMRERGYDHVQEMLAQGKLDSLESARLPKRVARRRIVTPPLTEELTAES